MVLSYLNGVLDGALMLQNLFLSLSHSLSRTEPLNKMILIESFNTTTATHTDLTKLIKRNQRGAKDEKRYSIHKRSTVLQAVYRERDNGQLWKLNAPFVPKARKSPGDLRLQ